jgi:hexosaminidase
MDIIPKPTSLLPDDGCFTLSGETRIYVAPATVEVLAIGHYLAERLRPATGYELPVDPIAGPSVSGHVYLTLLESDASLGDEGYTLRCGPEGITLAAHKPAGLFWGIQTVRQLLPPAIEAPVQQLGPWHLPAVQVRDTPRFSWRGAMLDVGRHFFSVDDVKCYIDHLAHYKVNRFHLHLAEDQGWRIEIKTWPKLAEIGGSTQVGGGPGGYYTQEQYAEIVRYAQSRYMTVVPEVDMPGHTMAALAAYPELSREGIMPSLYTGVDVGVSSLNTHSELTYKFVDDVIRELAILTPGPYIHIGGDEAYKTPESDYIPFMERVQAIIRNYGKIAVGWQEIAKCSLLPSTVVQFWTVGGNGAELARRAASQGASIIMSPASKTYLDMKYDQTTALGQKWAGFVEVQTSYEWDPATFIAGLPEDQVLGVEAPLWTETVCTLGDIEYMAFPRLPGINEIGWSPLPGRGWEEYRLRLASHAARFQQMGIGYYRSPQVSWGI